MAGLSEIKGLTFFFSKDYISFLFSVAGEKCICVCEFIQGVDHGFFLA